jgi:hypothetical protein
MKIAHLFILSIILIIFFSIQFDFGFDLKKRVNNISSYVVNNQVFKTINKMKKKFFKWLISKKPDFINGHVTHNVLSRVKDNSPWKLIYQGTEDGFEASDFHENCDGHSNTLTIISANNHIFGGFVSIPWFDFFFYSLNKKKVFRKWMFL